MTSVQERRMAEPFFSICIPQYNRTSFLLAALRTIEKQDFRSFEICISDDVSPDGRQAEVISYLQQSGMAYAVVQQSINQRYDANLRASLSLARGRYCILLGNDDGLTRDSVLRDLANTLRINEEPGVALTNYRDAETRSVYRRVTQTRMIGTGPDVAVANFRNFSFVSGVLIRADLVHDYATANYDGSEMYQVYLVTRAVASGENLLAIDDVVIDKDLRISGESVDSYAAKPRVQPCPIEPRKFNLSSFPGVVSGALAHAVPAHELPRYNAAILQQLYSYTYPYWLVEFRRVQSWKYAAGIALGQKPAEMMRGLTVTPFDRLAVRSRFLFSTIAGLFVPVGFTQRYISPLWYRLAKRSGKT